MINPNLCKITLFSTFLLRELHGKENLAFLVKGGKKKWMQSSWLAWHYTEGPGCKEVQKTNLLFCILSEALIKFRPS